MVVPVRIAFVARLYHPAKGGHLQSEAEWQASHGYDVHVVTAQAGSELELHNPTERSRGLPLIEQVNGVTVWRVVPSWRLLKFLLSYIWKLPILWRIPSLFNDQWQVLRHGPYIPGLLWRLLRLRPDVIHVVAIYGPLTGIALLAGLILRRPVVVMPCIHANEAWSHINLVIRWLTRCQRVLVFTEFEKEFLLAKGVPAKRIVVTGLGTSLLPADAGSIERVRHKYNLPADAPIVLHLARLAPYKGGEALVLAMKQLWSEGARACLILAGALDDGGAWIEGTLSDLGTARDYVRVISDFPDDEKPALLSCCSIMAMPSRSESFGISYIEAWSQRRPVLASPESAAASFIEEGVTGFLVSQDDREGMVNALRKAIYEPELMNKMGLMGYQLVEQKYRWDVVGHLVRKEYEAVIAG